MFSLDRLTCFVAVAEELHFGRAADRLHMTQPPLSRQIQILEKEVGVQLVIRTSRPVTLTPAGIAFLPEARRILYLVEGAALTARRVPDGDLGSVTIGFTGAAAHAVLTPLIKSAGDLLPDVDLRLREMISSAQLEALSRGQLDLALARPPLNRPGIESQPLLREPLVAALPSGDPLAYGPRRLTIQDFDDQPVVMYSHIEARYFYELLVNTFSLAGCSPRYVQYVTEIHTMLTLVQSGIGLALVPASAARLRLDGVVFRPVDTEWDLPVALDAAWLSDNDNPALHKLIRNVLPRALAIVGHIKDSDADLRTRDTSQETIHSRY